MSIHSEATSSEPLLVQHESVAALPLISFVIFILIGIGTLIFLASYWFKHEGEQVNLVHAAEATYPKLERLQSAGLQQLNRYEMLENGAFRIPVEQAIIRLTEEFPEGTRISEEMLP